MGKAYLFLTDGVEEMEAITPLDILRRAGVEIYTVGIPGKTVTGSHNITLEADFASDAFLLPSSAEMLIFPGGPGVDSMRKNDFVKEIVKEGVRRNLYLAAICAAPLVLYDAGILEGKKVTAFPSVQEELKKVIVTGTAVEIDGKVITARSAGVAFAFARVLAEMLAGKDISADAIGKMYPEE